MSAAEDGPEMPEGRGYRMRGAGSTTVPVGRRALWGIVMDESRLAAAIPGAETLERVEGEGPRTYAADVGIGVGRIRGTYRVTVEFTECLEPETMILTGGAQGPFGHSSGEGWVNLIAVPGGTEVHYTYAILISGTVAILGGKLLDNAADRLIARFFERLARAADARPQTAGT